jgi:hypothetical protein
MQWFGRLFSQHEPHTGKKIFLLLFGTGVIQKKIKKIL